MADKDIQKRVHEGLYNNLYFLSLTYPTSKEFKLVFKHDMFVKNNKAAFHHVIYYLLNVLNPELAREKLASWPLYDIKRETKFRSEVLKYINELNDQYDDANIPQITASHLISPGGFKFAWFAFKLSQFVMFEILKKTDANILKCPKLSNHSSSNETTLNNLKTKVKVNEKEIYDILQGLDNYSVDIQRKARLVEEELSDCNKNIGELRRKRNSAISEFNKKYPDFPSVKQIKENLESAKIKWENIRKTHELFIHCNDLLNHLGDSNSVLKHDHKKFIVPVEVQHIVKNQENIDLIEFFNGLCFLIEHYTVELPNPSDEFFSRNNQKIDELIEKCIELQNIFTETEQECDTQLQTLKENLDNLRLKISKSESSGDSNI